MNCCIQFTPSPLPTELWTWLGTSGDIREHLKPLLSEFKFPFIVSSCPELWQCLWIEKCSSEMGDESHKVSPWQQLWVWLSETDPIVHISEIAALTVIKSILEKVNWHKYFTGPITHVIVKASKLIHSNISQRIIMEKPPPPANLCYCEIFVFSGVGIFLQQQPHYFLSLTNSSRECSHRNDPSTFENS